MRKSITTGLIALFAIVMCVATVQAQNATSSTDNSLTWEFDRSTKTLTISGEGEMPDFGVIRNIPPWDELKHMILQLVITEGVTSIGYCAFASLPELQVVRLPKSLTKIGGSAFMGCMALRNVTIPAGVNEIDAYAFSNCVSLTQYTVDEGNATYADVDGVIFNKEKTSVLMYPIGREDESYHIPAGVKTTGKHAFVGLVWLTEVTAPAGMESFGASAFTDCRRLKSVTLPDGFLMLNEYAFNGCENLENIVVLGKTPPQVQSGAFYHTPLSNITLTVPKGAKAAYAAAPVWKEFKQIAESTVSNVLLPEARIYTADGRLYFTLSRAETVHIYNVSGALVRTFNAPAGETSVTLPQGVYVVRAGERTKKVFIH